MTLKGCHVALVTPFDKGGTIDESSLRNHIDYLIDEGVAGIVPCGTTGESATLSWEEHNRIVAIAVEQTAKRAIIIAGAGSNNTAESIGAAKHAEKSGANAILCITPYYNKPTQEGLFHHFLSIANEVTIPIVLYNVPGRTGVNLYPSTIERLCEHPNISAIKEASGDIHQVSEIHRRLGDRLTILSGDDALTFPLLAVGAQGVISVVSNIAPQKMVSLINRFEQGDIKNVRAIHEDLMPLCDAMFIETNPIAVKTAMNLIGMNGGALRLPLVPMKKDNKERLISVLRSYNFSIKE